MSNDSGKKKLYSFYVSPDRLERLTKLSGFLSIKNGQRVTVSNLINLAVEQYIDRNQAIIEAMETLSQEVEAIKRE